MAAAIAALDRGTAQPTVVIWRGGQVEAFTWGEGVRTVNQVETRWQAPDHHPWLRVQDAEGYTFLIGRRQDAWWAMPWPPGHGPKQVRHRQKGALRMVGQPARGRVVQAAPGVVVLGAPSVPDLDQPAGVV